MRFSRIMLRDWKNFGEADVALANRVFVVGQNAIGKSNLLDVFRFLRDLATAGGGLEKAVDIRGGMKRLRNLHSQGGEAGIRVAVEVADGQATWTYDLAFVANRAKASPVLVSHEIVRYRERPSAADKLILSRPDTLDRKDSDRLSETALEQISANKNFRPLVEFFRSVRYLHLVPQLIREGQAVPEGGIGPDSYGRDLLGRVKACPKATRDRRLGRIQKLLNVAVPYLKDLALSNDNLGHPHLQVKFSHWRGFEAHQDEKQFSDGTLRLIGLLWSLQDKDGPLLLEEPEFSLHTGLLQTLAPFISAEQKASGRKQVMLSTHSEALIGDEGIAPEEILFIRIGKKGSELVAAATVPDIVYEMNNGFTAAEAVMPRAKLGQGDFLSVAER